MTSIGKEKVTVYHWLLFASCFLGTAFAGVVSTLMSVYLPVAVKDLLGTKNEGELNTISAYINSVFIFGGAAGGLICGWVSDRWGRKPGVIISIMFNGVFTLLTAFMPEWWGVVICRFLSGFGLGGILVTTTTMLMEEWPARSRAIFIGILSISIPVGIFSAGVIDYFVSSWRQAFYIGMLPVILAFLVTLFLKESGPWQKKRNSMLLDEEKNTTIFSSIYTKDLFVGSVIFGTMLIGLWAIFLWIPTWIHGLVVEGDAQHERGISMMMLGLGGLTGGFISGWIINRIGIRKSLLLCFGVCALASFVLFTTNSSFSFLIYVEIAILALFFGISQGVLSVYIPGLFPVEVRGSATGFCFNTGRILTGIAVLMVGVLITTLGGYANSLFVFSWVFIVGLAATIFTKQKYQEELTTGTAEAGLLSSSK